jgi:hypothetical protein
LQPARGKLSNLQQLQFGTWLFSALSGTIALPTLGGKRARVAVRPNGTIPNSSKASGLRFSAFQPALAEFPHDWQHGNNDNAEDHNFQIVSDERKVPEEVTGANKKSDP